MTNLDQNFTPDDVAEKLSQSVVERYDPYKVRTYLEPSVGDGAFVRGLMAAGIQRQQIITCDIDPNLEADHTGDFLDISWSLPEDTITIGNPPFGRNGGTAKKFVKHALSFCEVCCFVLPLGAVYQKRTTALDISHVRFSGTDAKCVWMEFCNYPYSVVETTSISLDKRPFAGFELVGPDDEYDVVIQRCGGGWAKVTDCNGTGEGKIYVKCADRRVLKAFKNIESYREYLPRPTQMTHQPSMNQQEMLELVLMSYFFENYLDTE